MRVGDVVEGEDAETEAEEEECAKRDEGPEGEDGNDLLLDNGRKRDELEEQSEVKRGHEESKRNGLLGAGHDCYLEFDLFGSKIEKKVE